MQEEVGRLSEVLGWHIRLRIGLNTGPVVAGIIGRWTVFAPELG